MRLKIEKVPVPSILYLSTWVILNKWLHHITTDTWQHANFGHVCLYFMDNSYKQLPARKPAYLCGSVCLPALHLLKNWKVPIVLVKFTARLQLNKWDQMNLMRPRVSEVYYPEAMRHIVRKRTVTNKTPSQNNGDILIWSAGWLQAFLFSFFLSERKRRK